MKKTRNEGLDFPSDGIRNAELRVVPNSKLIISFLAAMEATHVLTWLSSLLRLHVVRLHLLCQLYFPSVPLVGGQAELYTHMGGGETGTSLKIWLFLKGGGKNDLKMFGFCYNASDSHSLHNKPKKLTYSSKIAGFLLKRFRNLGTSVLGTWVLKMFFS